MNHQAFVQVDTIARLKKEILSLEGYQKARHKMEIDAGLGSILQSSFPGGQFPVGAVHEFTSHARTDVASTNGFMSGIIGKLMQNGGACLWISTQRTLFPPALKLFGVDPERIIFADPARSKDALWAIEEALKCSALAAVVGELTDLSFTESRRLQLAVEQSQVTGFIHRINARTENTVACVTRWKIRSIAGNTNTRLPGVGLPRWNVELAKVRNGVPGAWQMEWTGKNFRQITAPVIVLPNVHNRKAG